MRRVTRTAGGAGGGLVLLRVIAVAALILLLWNPASSRTLPSSDQPIVLLDASLSMSGPGGPWRGALDTARALARQRGALVWRFGARVSAFDTTPPTDGATHLAPALEAAAARGGEVVVVSDGVVDDVAGIPADLLRRPRVVVQPRAPFFDAYVADVEGQRRVSTGDTIRLRVSFGVAGRRDARSGMRNARLSVSTDGRSLASRRVSLPDSGVLSEELTLPASRIPRPGWNVLDVRLDGVNDAEPRDDARQFVVEVSSQPAAVIFASPPDWETRFLARTLSDVARVPVKVFVETEQGRWRDGATLAPIAPAELTRAAQGARLLVLTGDPERARRYVGTDGAAARLIWSTGGQPGDWYVERPPASPLAAALAGIAWDSLPPATGAGVPPRDSTAIVALTARLARRGTPRPIVTLAERIGVGGNGGNGGNARQVTVTASGLWRWAFRGGAAEEAYRGLVAGMVDWLLGERGARSRERAVPVTLETPNGLPLVWRWTGADEPRPLAITLEGEGSDTLRFDAAGRAELLLRPGVYRYELRGGPERGVVAVETYSDEWPPRPPSLGPQPGQSRPRVTSTGLRDRWWLFVIAIAALAAEWAWRRRQGLP
ncbi:MAG: hypothetical protein WD773_11550 [Gemmatimonadales bacterium]